VRHLLKHFMIDLETMGVRPTSAIVSIGVVHFDKTSVLGEFYTPVSLADCLKHGLTQDQSTIDWWAKQPAEARDAWQRPDAPPLADALVKMSRWMQTFATPKFICPWGNGSDFDNVLMVNAFNALSADPPWKFYNHHCFRTMKNMFQVADVPRQGTHHNALDDAHHQVRHFQSILQVHNLDL